MRWLSRRLDFLALMILFLSACGSASPVSREITSDGQSPKNFQDDMGVEFPVVQFDWNILSDIGDPICAGSTERAELYEPTTNTKVNLPAGTCVWLKKSSGKTLMTELPTSGAVEVTARPGKQSPLPDWIALVQVKATAPPKEAIFVDISFDLIDIDRTILTISPPYEYGDKLKVACWRQEFVDESGQMAIYLRMRILEREEHPSVRNNLVFYGNEKEWIGHIFLLNDASDAEDLLQAQNFCLNWFAKQAVRNLHSDVLMIDIGPTDHRYIGLPQRPAP